MTAANPWGEPPGRATDLRELFGAVLRGRASLTTDLNLPQPQPHLTRAARARLISALEAYSGALVASQLPVPHSIRDELRLQRSVATLRGPASQRGAGGRSVEAVRPHGAEQAQSGTGWRGPERRRRSGDRRACGGDRRGSAADRLSLQASNGGTGDRRR